MSLSQEVRRSLSSGTTEKARLLGVLEEQEPGLPHDVTGWMERQRRERMQGLYHLLGEDGFVHSLGETDSPLVVSPHAPDLLVSLHPREDEGFRVRVETADLGGGLPYREATQAFPNSLLFAGDPLRERFVLVSPHEMTPSLASIPQARALYQKKMRQGVASSSEGSPSRTDSPTSCCGSTPDPKQNSLGVSGVEEEKGGEERGWLLTLLVVFCLVTFGGILWAFHSWDNET